MPQTIGLDRDDGIPSIRAKLESARGEPLEVVVPDGLEALRSPLGMRLLGRHLRRSGLRASICTHDDFIKRLARAEGIPVTSLPVSARGTRDEGMAALHQGSDVQFSDRQHPTAQGSPLAAWVGGAALLGSVLLAAGLVFLPAATVTLRSVSQPVDETLAVTASTLAGASDVKQLAIPAKLLQTEVTVRQITTVRAIQKVPEAKSAGRVTFTNLTETSLEIPARSRVSTPAGFAFQTGSPTTLRPGERQTVAVTAVEGGEEGNVGARAISVVRETGLAGRVTVENEAPLRGGTTVERLIAKDEDVAQLRQQAVEAARREGAERIRKNLPNDVSFYDESVRLIVDHDLIERDVGPEAITFAVSVQGVAVALGFVGRDLNQLIGRHLADKGHGFELDGRGIQIRVLGLAESSNDSIVFHVQAGAGFRTKVAPDQVRAAVKGKTPSEAREILMARYSLAGTPEIETWPFWVASVPNGTWRVDVRVLPAAR